MNNSQSFHTWPCTIKRHSLDWFCSKQYRTTQRSIKIKKMFGGGRVGRGRGIVGTWKRTGSTRERTRWIRERSSWTRTVWFGSATKSDIKRLQQTVRLLRGIFVPPCLTSKIFISPEWGKGLRKSLWTPHTLPNLSLNCCFLVSDTNHHNSQTQEQFLNAGYIQPEQL